MKSLFVFLWGYAYAISPFTIYQNNQAVDTIAQNKNVDPSYFYSLIQNNPQEWVLYWNQIVANVVAQNPEEAIRNLQWLLSLLPETEKTWRFYSYYQLGKILGEQKKVSEALEAYQQALDLVPDSKEVTVNMELLLQSGGGGQNGDNQQENQEQNKQQQQDKQEQEQKPKEEQNPQEQPSPKPTPKPFDSKDLSQEDVRRILDELKRQEEVIRAKMDENKPKEKDLGKDW